MEQVTLPKPNLCPICSSSISSYCSAKVLGKYDVQYFKCVNCEFIFTEPPYWLDEAYNSAITHLDIGLTERNQLMVPVVEATIKKWFNADGKFIDYGGGYGMLVRMMRDNGFDYYRQDIHCANLFAASFDISDTTPFKAELLTAFEVMEHLVNPVIELEKMLQLSDAILFSTTVQPTNDVTPDSWWYFTPETGQHISLYSRSSLKSLANRFSLNYCWNEQNIHLFSRKPINNRLFKAITHPRFCHWYNNLVGKRTSLQSKDFSLVKNRLKNDFTAESNLNN